MFLKGSVTTLYNYNTQAQLPSVALREREAKKRRDLPSCPDLPRAAWAAVNLKKWRGDNGGVQHTLFDRRSAAARYTCKANFGLGVGREEERDRFIINVIAAPIRAWC